MIHKLINIFKAGKVFIHLCVLTELHETRYDGTFQFHPS